jgi:hypothetical protein
LSKKKKRRKKTKFANRAFNAADGRTVCGLWPGHNSLHPSSNGFFPAGPPPPPATMADGMTSPLPLPRPEMPPTTQPPPHFTHTLAASDSRAVAAAAVVGGDVVVLGGVGVFAVAVRKEKDDA